MTTMIDSATATPERSLEQRRDALVKANDIRSFRARRKVELKAGRANPLAQLLDPPPEMGTMKVFDLLIALPKVGRVKANRALTVCRISPSKTLGGMSERQRGELAHVLGTRAAGPETATAAAVIDRLLKAGLGEAGLPGWWRTVRQELGDRTPHEALGGDQRAVLALADSDADAIRQDLGAAGTR